MYIYAVLCSYLLSLESKSDVEEFLGNMLGDKVCQTFVRELYVRWQPVEGNTGLLARAEKLTELVRAREDDLILFAQKGAKCKEKRVRLFITS